MSIGSNYINRHYHPAQPEFPRRKTDHYIGDRFIPCRMGAASGLRVDDSETVAEFLYSERLIDVLIPEARGPVLVFNAKKHRERTAAPLRLIDEMRAKYLAPTVLPRGKFPKSPRKILDAPGIPNDFYLKAIDLMGTTLAIALKDEVYFCSDIRDPKPEAAPQLNAERDSVFGPPIGK